MPSGYTAPARTTAERESSKFMLLGSGFDGRGDHSQPLWPGGLPDGALRDRSTALCPTNLPAQSEVFVGRQVVVQQTVQALFATKCRCVCLVGAGGIGKTALAVAVCHYARLRHVFCSGVHQIDARGLKSVPQLTYAMAAALNVPTTADAEEAVVREEVRLLYASHLKPVPTVSTCPPRYPPRTATDFMNPPAASSRRLPTQVVSASSVTRPLRDRYATVTPQVVSALSARQGDAVAGHLLYIDRCDDLSGAEHAPSFTELLALILRRAPRTKLLLTCRRSLGIAGENPVTINVPELSTGEAQQMLRRMDPVRREREGCTGGSAGGDISAVRVWGWL